MNLTRYENHLRSLARNLIPDVRIKNREPSEQEMDDTRVWASLRVGRVRREAATALDQYRKSRK